MGRVVAPYGIKGWVKIQPFSALPDALLDHPVWHLERKPFAKSSPSAATSSEQKTLSLAQGRQHGAHLIVSFSEISTREDAENLVGMSVVVDRDTLPAPDPGEFYCVDLIGMTVVNRENLVLGRIASIQSYGAQPILHVAPNGDHQDAARQAPCLIPFVAQYIDRVFLEEKRVYVDFDPNWNL